LFDPTHDDKAVMDGAPGLIGALELCLPAHAAKYAS